MADAGLIAGVSVAASAVLFAIAGVLWRMRSYTSPCSSCMLRSAPASRDASRSAVVDSAPPDYEIVAQTHGVSFAQNDTRRWLESLSLQNPSETGLCDETPV